MTTKQLLINWITTIFLGSTMLPISLKTYEWMQNKPFEFESSEFMAYLVIGLILSALSSVPVMLLILVINNGWVKQIEPFQKRMRISALVHVLLGAAALCIFSLTVGNNILDAIPFIAPYALASTGFHLYQCQKSYHKPQVLNFPA